MCQRKPGRRCPSHAVAALSAAQRRYDAADARLAAGQDPTSKTPPSRVQDYQRRKAAAAAHLADARTDADSTAAGRDALLGALADESLSPAKRERLSARFEHAEALTSARAQQRSLMPPMSGHRTGDEARAFTTLGDSRDALARVDAALAVADDDSPQQRRLSAQREVLTQQVFAHDVQHRLAAAQGRPDPVMVSPDEQRAARDGDISAQRALTVLSHQRAAAAGGGHDERFQSAVRDAEAGFRRRYMPEVEPSPGAAPAGAESTQQQARGAGQRPGRGRPRGGGRRKRKAVLSAREAKALMRKARQVTKGDKVTPGKHQGGPLLPDAV